MLSSEAYQFDWSRDIVVMDRVMPTVKVAHVRLYRSRDARAQLSVANPVRWHRSLPWDPTDAT
jgi:hypothetical protein